MRLRQKLIAAAMPALAILAALLIVAVMIAGVGESPAEAYRILAQGAVGDWRSLTDTLVRTVPLIFTGLSFAFAAKCNRQPITPCRPIEERLAGRRAAGILDPPPPVALQEWQREIDRCQNIHQEELVLQ